MPGPRTKPTKRKFSDKVFARALQQTGGLYAHAARWIETATGKSCAANTVANACKTSPYLQRVLENVRCEMDDLVESALLTKIKEGDVACIIFYCKTRLRDRGYQQYIPPEPLNELDYAKALEDMLDRSGRGLALEAPTIEGQAVEVNGVAPTSH